MVNIARLKFWMTARWRSFSKPRSVHQSVGTTPVAPPRAPIMPPMLPARASAAWPPRRIGGSLLAKNSNGQTSISSTPRTNLKVGTSRCGSSQRPMGRPAQLGQQPEADGQARHAAEDEREQGGEVPAAAHGEGGEDLAGKRSEDS